MRICITPADLQGKSGIASSSPNRKKSSQASLNKSAKIASAVGGTAQAVSASASALSLVTAMQTINAIALAVNVEVSV